jgi:hypothetical protein
VGVAGLTRHLAFDQPTFRLEVEHRNLRLEQRATRGYVLTLTIDGGAEFAFHFYRAGLDSMVEAAQVLTRSVTVKRPDVVN